MDSNLIENFTKTEEQLKTGLIEKEKGIKILNGQTKILLSAPHSIEQTREGKIKYGEWRTAPLVIHLHKKTNCFGAFKTINKNDDANYDEKNYYKDELIKLVRKENIKLLLDLHIMSSKRENSVDIGTGEGRNIQYKKELLKIIRDNLTSNSIDKVAVDYRFKAMNENTVSATIARECKIPCFQLEINWDLLNGEGDEIHKIINALSESIEELKKKI